jgi:anaerobic ribonucleoside-triphosphate reductase
MENNIELINSYIQNENWLVKENSNTSYSIQGLNNYIASEIIKEYWLNKIYPPKIRDMHLDGNFHIHDLHSLSVYCVGWNLFDLLTKGFISTSGKCESRPAKHFRSILGQIVNFFVALQGETAGAQAFSNFDTLIAPFIRFDNLSYLNVKQALQEFIYNLNVPIRTGFQTAFTNLSFDLKCPQYLEKEPVIIGGKFQASVYGDYQREIDLINKAFLEIMIEGDAKGRVFSFPIPTYNITNDFDWDNENISALWELTAKYGIPYFSNFINSDNSPEDIRSMCCRLRIDNSKLLKRGGGLFGVNPLTGSIGVITINMPRLGYLSANETDFIQRLAQLLEIAKEGLMIKREYIEKLTEQDLYPLSKYYLADLKKHFGEYWRNHFSTIGLVGMNEACLNLLKVDIGTSKGQEFTKQVLDFIREKLFDYQQQTGQLWNLEATPAEATSYRLAKKDKEKYPDIICANEKNYRSGSQPFYTNSTQLPVNYTSLIVSVKSPPPMKI